MEIDRREIKPSPVYYCAVRESASYKALTGDEMSLQPTTKRERWVCHSMPVLETDFAVYLLDGIE